MLAKVLKGLRLALYDLHIYIHTHKLARVNKWLGLSRSVGMFAKCDDRQSLLYKATSF